MGDVSSLHQRTGRYGGVNRFTTISLHDSRPTRTCMHLYVMSKQKQTNFSVFFNVLAPKKTYSACSVTQPVDQSLSLSLTTANRLPNNWHKHEALAQCWADVSDGGPTLGQCLMFTDHTQSHIKNARPGPHIFGDFSVNSKPISLKFCKCHFLFKS